MDDRVDENTEVERYQCLVNGCNESPKSSMADIREHIVKDHSFDARLDAAIESVTLDLADLRDDE
ncbi:hypothetical protein C449_01077 [Halococcus saccharolyticus DSM 5350]|uniref:Uncharacterized protein n=2 Tax=Halococcus saccharolyticus TaxID=62319 RepID=M0MPI2_9EURY|nr:hypothetical protein C449_01077 [Halococcus saccharolyticus DSM 5350]